MTATAAFDTIERSLIRAFHPALTLRSGSHAALGLHTSPPALSGRRDRMCAAVRDLARGPA